ncbi:hypothetical protein ACFTWD_30155 [Streptomyces sp. NPDC056943]|uniref:hypothetical protein n=1 Tax=Streptomyces sp. NPDC056943 TaxID=3345971 RepID=UPI00363DCE74
MKAGALAVSLTLGSGAGLAWAVTIDNSVPTANYRHSCSEGQNGTVCQTDNADVYFYMDLSDGAGDGRDNKLEPGDQAVVRSVMANSYNGTDLNTYYDATPVFSGDSETDIYYEEDTPPPGLIGIAWCNDDSPAPAYSCDQQHVRIAHGYYDYQYSYGLVCHETGHAVGLLHGENAYPSVDNNDHDILHCMVKSDDTTRGLGPTNVANINANY